MGRGISKSTWKRFLWKVIRIIIGLIILKFLIAYNMIEKYSDFFLVLIIVGPLVYDVIKKHKKQK
jgi:uncharacterized membrane protein HdeD (DUF308 family)